MKILFLGDASTANTQSYISALRELGSEVLCLSLHQPIRELQVPWVRWRRTRGKWQYLTFIPYLRRIVAVYQPHVVIGYRLTSYGLLAVHSGARPVVVTTTGFDVFWNPILTHAIRKWILRHVLNRADLVISWQEHLTQALPKSKKCAPVITLPRGIDLDLFKPETLCTANRDLRIVTTRSLKRWYSMDVVLRAFSEVRRSIPEATLSIIGDGPARGELELMAASLGVAEAVYFEGQLPIEEVAQHLRLACVYTTQIAFDGVSASLLEAMASGVLPVVPDNAANRCWVEDGKNGLLVRVGDVSELAAALTRGLRDRRLRTEASRHNAVIVQKRANRRENMRIIDALLQQLVWKAKR